MTQKVSEISYPMGLFRHFLIMSNSNLEFAWLQFLVACSVVKVLFKSVVLDKKWRGRRFSIVFRLDVLKRTEILAGPAPRLDATLHTNASLRCTVSIDQSLGKQYMTRNARWRSRLHRYKATVHVPDFDILAPAPELSLADDDTIVSGATALERERECQNLVRERKLGSGDDDFVTWRSSSYIPGCVSEAA